MPRRKSCANLSTERLLQNYLRALQRYAASGGSDALDRAREAGRQALHAELGIPAIADAHHRTMAPVVLKALMADNFARAKETVGMFCASCPTSVMSESDLPAGKALEHFFADSLSVLTASHLALQRANRRLYHINQICEEEARRISHALHDEAGQMLSSAHLRIDEIAQTLGPPQRERLQGVREVLYEIEEQLRRLAHEIRPTLLDDLGLMPALEYLATGISKRSGIAITIRDGTRQRLPSACETALYRIVKEALTNVLRHSRATEATVEVTSTTREARCAIRDNGVGFNMGEVFTRSGERGLGLIGIQGRIDGLGGTVDINSAPGKGSRIRVRIPIGTAASARAAGAGSD